MESEKVKERCYWITYKEKRILNLDFTDLNETDHIFLMRYAKEFTENDVYDNILVLACMKNTSSSPSTMQEAKIQAKTQVLTVKKTAVYGVSHFQRIMANVLSNFTSYIPKIFPTRVDALEYLIEE